LTVNTFCIKVVTINSCQTSIEDVTEKDHYIHPNAGPVKNLNAILEAANGSNDTDMVIDDNHDNPEMPPLVVDDDPEDNDDNLEEEIQEKTNEKKLGIPTI
jgi:hypothetical protein